MCTCNQELCQVDHVNTKYTYLMARFFYFSSVSLKLFRHNCKMAPIHVIWNVCPHCIVAAAQKGTNFFLYVEYLQIM